MFFVSSLCALLGSMTHFQEAKKMSRSHHKPKQNTFAVSYFSLLPYLLMHESKLTRHSDMPYNQTGFEKNNIANFAVNFCMLFV